jgi:hypothetical protein
MNELTVLIDTLRPFSQSRGEAGAGLGMTPGAIDVEWEPSPVELPPEAAAYLEARWNVYLADAQARQRSLFNGPVTRLIDASMSGDRLRLRLGPADYKTFLVTCIRDREWFKARAPQAATPALGNSVLLTHGDQALLGIRAPQVSAYGGRAHLLGGVLDLLRTERFPASAAGLVSHLLLELQEEAHLQPADLMSGNAGYPRLLGILRDEVLAQPEAAWQWETIVPLEEIGGRLDRAEHSGSLLLRRGRPDEGTWRRMTPVARYTWEAWSGR